MHNRLKELRNYLKLSQMKFAASLGLGQSTLGMMEVGKREIGERHIKTICAIYKVNEEWLRTGKGEMFNKTSNNEIDNLAAKYNLDDFQKNLIQEYLNLTTQQKNSVKSFLLKIANGKINNEQISEEIPDEYKDMTIDEMIKESNKKEEELNKLEALIEKKRMLLASQGQNSDLKD